MAKIMAYLRREVSTALMSWSTFEPFKDDILFGWAISLLVGGRRRIREMSEFGKTQAK
jgi:hypothetical protein